jgi:5,10-methylenetetrahydromethanopterin reductase
MASDERIGLMFSDRPTVQEQIEVAKIAEANGYTSLWVGETRLSRDVISMLGALSATTSHVRLGAAIVNTWTRGPVLTALTFATLHELAPDRIVLGLGTYSDPLAEIQGIERRQPLQQMREYIEVVRKLFALGEPVTHETSLIRVRAAKLDLGYGLTRDPINVPIYIGATLPRMMRVAGELADGVLLNSFMSSGYTKFVIAEVHDAARDCGRDPNDVEYAQFIPVAMSEDIHSARAAARRVLAMYLGGQSHVAQAAGIDPGLAKRLQTTLGGWPPPASGVEQAMRLVSDDLVDELTACGDADYCRERVRERRNAGVSHPIVFPLMSNTAEVCRAFAPSDSAD